jgi:hypothetical protein
MFYYFLPQEFSWGKILIRHYLFFISEFIVCKQGLKPLPFRQAVFNLG